MLGRETKAQPLLVWDPSSGPLPKTLVGLAEMQGSQKEALARGEIIFSWHEGALAVECGACGGAFVLDFSAPGTRRALASSGGRDPLHRALAKVPRSELVIDATMGLAMDSLRIASWGWSLHSLEQSAAVFALVEDARKRAQEEMRFREALARWRCERITAQDKFREWQKRPPAIGAIYLDPMFAEPKGDKRPRKEICLLGLLAHSASGTNPGPELSDSNQELLQATLALNPGRIIVKRPLKARPLAPKVAVAYSGKSHRFDVYIRGVSY